MLKESTDQEISEVAPNYLGSQPDLKQTFILLRRRCPTCKGVGVLYVALPDTINQPQNVGKSPEIPFLGASEGYGYRTPRPCPSCTKVDPTLTSTPSNPWGQGWFDEWVTLEQFKEIIWNG